jgi:hypothetical protein
MGRRRECSKGSSVAVFRSGAEGGSEGEGARAEERRVARSSVSCVSCWRRESSEEASGVGQSCEHTGKGEMGI